MSVKYRIRLKNERVIGPFSEEEIGELHLKGHINGTEMCQIFPIGDWKSLQSFTNLKSLISSKPNTPEKERKTEIVVTPKEEQVKAPEPEKIEKKRILTPEHRSNITNSSQIFNEFKFGKDVKIDIDYDELEKRYKEENPDKVFSDEIEKTVVVRRASLKPDIDKTVVVKRAEVIEEVQEEEKAKEPVVEYREEPPPPSREELINEKTEFINLAQSLPAINAQLSVSEVELEKIAKIEELQEKKRLRELQEIMLREEALEEGHEEDEVEVIEEYSKEKKEFEQRVIVKKKRKNMSIVAILAFLGIFYFFLQEEEKPTVTGPLYLEVKFPITNQEENIPVANEALKNARALYAKGSYKPRALSTGMYLTSLQNRFSGNEALGEIILAYSELIDNTKEKNSAANTLYKFVQLSESKLLSDPNVVTGTAHFYGKIKKYQTGIYIVKNYLRAGNKATPKMLSYYLGLLVDAGEFVEARKVYETLKKIPKKPFESYYELAKFDIADDRVADAKVIIEEGLKYFPGSVLLLLQYSDILLKEQSLKAFEETLEKIKILDSEGSPSFMASYFQYMGYLSALKNQNKVAGQYFKKSLEFKESEDLRITLSKLEIGGDKVAQSLILESKVIGLLKKAKDEFKNKNIENAFQFAIEAADADPDYIPAVLFQAELNTYRGFFESAIYGLQKAMNDHPKNNLVKKMLVETYISSFKLEDAERLLGSMSQTDYATTAEYASLMGAFSLAKKRPIIALKWYDRALSRDPLSDSDMYKMARILVRNNKFTDARNRLSKALLLDPKNVDYHALYSEILFEQDGTDTAIGYLRDTITELGEDPVLISAITTAYFKSGQLKEFQAYYKKVQDMPKKDERLFEVLISAAKLEGRWDEYIKHVQELLKLNPGNLKMRMELGNYLYEDKKYDLALAEFNEVKSKLSSYPQVHYQIARVHLAKNELDLARETITKELELNPNFDSAHFIMGEIHRINKDYHDAIVKYEKAIGLNPKSVEALVAMATMRIGQNFNSEAIDLLTRALRWDMNNPAIYKLMGDAYRAAGQRALAKEKYEDYLKLNPGAQDKDLIESLIMNLK